MPGEEEGPPGDRALETARLDAVAARLETLGAALQRSIGETTESTATLSRTVGTVSSDLGGLIGEAVTALGQTRKLVLATDDAAGSVAQAFEQIEARLGELTAQMAETVARQARLEDDRPGPEAIAAAVGAEVSRALTTFAEQITAQMETMVTGLQEERALLADQIKLLSAKPTTPPLTEKDVRAQVDAVVTPGIEDLHDALAQLVTEVHEDRAVLSRRLAGQREVEELRELVETLAARSDVAELQEHIAALQEAVAETVGRADVEDVVAELQGGLETVIDAALAAHKPDDAPMERLRTDLLALGDDLATTAKRAGAGQRAIEELRRQIEKDIPAEVEQALTAASGEIKHDAEVLMAELHDDLSLVMRQVVAGNQELEALREAVAELVTRADEEPEAAAATAGSDVDVAGELAPVVRSVGDDVMRAVGELHEDLALVLKRLAAGQRELDDVREAMLAAAERVTGEASATVDTAEVAGAVRDELASPLAELGDDLSVIVRSVSGTQEELDGIRASIADLTDTVAATTDALAAAQAEAELEAEDVEDVEVEEGPDLVELVEGLRVDIDAGLGAAVSDLRDELDSVRGLVTNQPEPLDIDAVRTEVDALLADVREDLALIAQQLANGQDDVAGFRAEVLENLVAPAPEPDADRAVALAEGLADDVRSEVAALGEELRGQFDRLRHVVGRRSEAPAVDLEALAPEVAAEVSAAVEPVVQGLHDDLTVLAGQLDDARAAIEQLQAAAPADEGTDVVAVVAELHDDLAMVLGQVVVAQQDLQLIRDEVAAGQEDLRSVLDAVSAVDTAVVRDDLVALAATQEDVRAVLEALLAGQEDVRTAVDGVGGTDAEDLRTLLDAVMSGQDDVRALRDEVGALLEVTPTAPSTPDVEQLEVAIADLPAIMSGELRAEIEVLADELRAGLSTLEALASTPASASDTEQLEQLEVAIADLPAVMAGELRTEIDALADELRAGLSQLQALAGTGSVPTDVEHLEVAIADLPAVVGAELRAELETMTDEVRAGLSQLQALAAGAPPADTEELGELRVEVQALVSDLQTDIGMVIREIVASHDEVSQLRAEVATVAEQVGDTLSETVTEAVVAAMPPAPVEDPALAIEGMRADVAAGLADMAADLRADLETLIAELHDDLGTIMNQVVAGQDDLDTLRQTLSELTSSGGAPPQVADDLDRLSRDLQALRDRIPGAAAATPPRRRPKARPQR